jgi:hypothetical protein
MARFCVQADSRKARWLARKESQVDFTCRAIIGISLLQVNEVLTEVLAVFRGKYARRLGIQKRFTLSSPMA